MKQAIARQRLIPFYQYLEKDPLGAPNGSPKGGLALHWVATAIMILATPAASDGYAFVVGLYTWGQTIVVGKFYQKSTLLTMVADNSIGLVALGMWRLPFSKRIKREVEERNRNEVPRDVNGDLPADQSIMRSQHSPSNWEPVLLKPRWVQRSFATGIFLTSLFIAVVAAWSPKLQSESPTSQSGIISRWHWAEIVGITIFASGAYLLFTLYAMPMLGLKVEVYDKETNASVWRALDGDGALFKASKGEGSRRRIIYTLEVSHTNGFIETAAYSTCLERFEATKNTDCDEQRMGMVQKVALLNPHSHKRKDVVSTRHPPFPASSLLCWRLE